ncbi:MAG: hypothetical protein WCJ57_01930 [Candidatus Falkowbacteria bacterium]
MHYKTTFPYGGKDKELEPIHIEKSLGVETGLTVEGHTWGHSGCKIILFDKNQQKISQYKHNDYESLGYHCTMAEEISHDINVILKTLGHDLSIPPQRLYGVMKQLRGRCELRHGQKLPNYNYEVLILFLP